MDVASCHNVIPRERARRGRDPGSSEIIGSAPPFQRSLTAARRAAACAAPVVIEGETGTGKELIARLIHNLSDRAKRPFVPVNCGCLPTELVENELFGHAAGAFTGAQSSSIGLVQQADGGTLFLDEIDTLAPRAQVALLRFLQQGEVRPVGDAKVIQVNCRIIAAANRRLPDLVASGAFREDLFFRLNVLDVSLPPLRARREDIPPLARHFLLRFGKAYGRRGLQLSNAALKWMSAQDWPGNVRELENTLHRAILSSDSDPIPLTAVAPTRHHGHPCEQRSGDRTHMPTDFDPGDEIEHFADAKARAIADWERQYLTQLMDSADGNVTAAAELAGKERRALGKLLKKHGIGAGRSHSHPA